jgi:hypothetical protein
VPAFTGLWRNPSFVKLWTGETISVFGSLIGRTALPFTAILVLDAGPLELVCCTLPAVPAFLRPLCRRMVDRLRRRPIAITADIDGSRWAPPGHVFDAPAMGQLYVVAFFVGS